MKIHYFMLFLIHKPYQIDSNKPMKYSLAPTRMLNKMMLTNHSVGFIKEQSSKDIVKAIR